MARAWSLTISDHRAQNDERDEAERDDRLSWWLRWSLVSRGARAAVLWGL
jgi:hypothetical protein